MRVIVDHNNKGEVLAYLSSLKKTVVAFDTETYGLKWNDKMFSLQLAVENEDSFYLNFHDYKDESPILERSLLAGLHNLWRNDTIRWVAHNAKFDMRRLDIDGIRLSGDIWDTMIVSHIQYNKHYSHSLDNCLKRLGLAKNDEVALWIKDNKAYTTHQVEGKKAKEKDLHFDRVPFTIMSKYGLDDVELTLQLYKSQEEYFNLPENSDQYRLIASNMQLVKSVYEMEAEGIRVNVDYCNKGYVHAIDKMNFCVKKIEELTSKEFKSGPKWLEGVLNEQQVELELSDKGNPILNKNTLGGMDNAVAHYILEMRNNEKEASFYSTFPRFADNNGIIHPSYRLTGTDTGRFSCSDPNLQQVPKESKAKEDQLYTVRGAFEAGEDFIFVSIDYDQMEYRIMADFANETGMIEAIKGGLDPHTYVSNMMGVDRTIAKTLNFGLLYGMGIAKLADALSVDMDRARTLKYRYYSELKNVQKLTREIQNVAVGRGFIKNPYGRRYFLDDPKWAYKMPNYLIQGTGADVVRHVIPKLTYCLEGMKSKLLLQIHDECVFKIHKSETFIVKELLRLMESEYLPINGMNLTCGIDWSPSTWDTRTFKPWSEYVGT
jgi:DNA polymerase I